MAKYNVQVEIKTVASELITIDASSEIDAHEKVREILQSVDKGYTYLPLGFKDSFKIIKVTKDD